MNWDNPLIITFLIAAATWRLSSLINSEAPFNWVRIHIFRVQQNDSTDTDTWFWPNNIIGSTLSCFWCLSLFISFLFSVGLTISLRTGIIMGAIVWLASATVAIMIERFIGRSRARW